MKKIFLLMLLCLGLQNSQAQTLNRRAFLGIQLAAVPDSVYQQASVAEGLGVWVQRVFPNSSAAAANLLAGDVIISVDKKEVGGVVDFLSLLKTYESGDEVKLGIARGAKKLKIDLPLKSMPEEQYEAASLQYGAVQGPTGLLRSILSLPSAPANGPKPVIYIIQGIDCGSIDVAFSPNGTFAQMIRAFNEAGFATYRVEKSGIGDSKGTPCRDCDFMQDAKGFLAGLRQLKQNPAIDSSQIYLLGLSMGGVWAPWMASQEPVKGLIAYGTISRPFNEYLLENFRRQAILAGTDFAEIETNMKSDARLYHYMFEEGLTPSQTIEQYPELAARIQQISADPDGEAAVHLFANRSYQFHQQLQQLNVSQAWSKVDAKVLAVWGQGDYVSNQADHTLIRDIVNYYHPGQAEYAEIDANHWFEQTPDMQTAYAARQSNQAMTINQEVFALFIDWINKQS
ncbi:MAG: alpha/beta fold hydrolase [Bacteroidota bacterium]